MDTPAGKVALIAMASGLVPDGGNATASRAGVNELHVAGDKPSDEDTRRILQSIGEARRKADLVIVYEHNHIFAKPFQTIMLEELPERLVPPEWLKKWTHAEIDAGADIVVMHGAPLLHGVEIYRGHPIFFDLGNFIFQVPPPDTLLDEPILWESVVAYVEFGAGTRNRSSSARSRRTRSARVSPTCMRNIPTIFFSRHVDCRSRQQGSRRITY
jgi:poly-gamma-glutamate capsule biosynthesis protein CapA/YwtB (metallophosphatase superfamily)